MKKLQKLLSVLIATAVMISMVPAVFAEGTEAVTPSTLIEENTNVNQEPQEEADQPDVQAEALVAEAPAEEMIAPALTEVDGNVDITWARGETALSASGKLDFNWDSGSIDWQWSDVSGLETSVTDSALVWNGEAGHSSAKWSGAGMNRFTGTFAIPEGCSTNDNVHLASIVQDAYTGISAGIGSDPILPINDDIFVFLYKEGETIDNTNFMEHLAFWSGVENQNGVITFNGVPGTAVKHFISGSASAPFEVHNPDAAAALKVSDGWACAAPLDNMGKTLFKNYPNADQNTKFVIDIFTYDTSAGGGGGMDELVMSFTPTNNYSATIRYWKDAVGGTGTLLHEEGYSKQLFYGQKITLESQELNAYKSVAGDSYNSGIQAQTDFHIVADPTQNIIDVLYTPIESRNVVYTWSGNIPERFAGAPATQGVLVGTENVQVNHQESPLQGTLAGVRGTFTFGGWTTEDTAVENGIFTMPNKDVTFTGSWTFTAEKTYSVTYQFAKDTNGSLAGFLPNPASTDGHYAGDSVKQARPIQETLEVKNEEGTAIGAWTFSGWGPDITATNEDITVDGSGNFIMPNRNVVFVGTWTYSNYAKVTFYHYYGIGLTQEYDTAETVYLPQNNATLTTEFINGQHDTEDSANKFHTDDAIRENHGKIEPRGFEAWVYMASVATRAAAGPVKAPFTDGHMDLTGVREARVHLMYSSYYPVTAEIDYGGRISATGTKHANPDFANYYLGVYRSATITYKAADGYRVVSVTDNGEPVAVAENGIYVLSKLAKEHNIVVKTEINPVPPTPTPDPDPDPTPTPRPDPKPDPKPDPTPVTPVTPVPPVDPAAPEILPDDPTPLAPAPDTAGGDTVIMIDEDTPLGNLPQTGMQDKRNLSAAGMATMGLSALLTLAGFFFKKRQENG